MKNVLITGAGSGLGRGTAIGLAKSGHRVFPTTHIWAQATDLLREGKELGLDDRLIVDKLDVLEMIDKMIEVIGADDGLYRNVWPPSIETLIKQVHERAWTLRTHSK